MKKGKMTRAIAMIRPLSFILVAMVATYSFTDAMAHKDCRKTWIEVKGGVEIGQHDSLRQDYVNQSLMGGGLFVRGCRDEENAGLAD